jgi:hypothetical protein
MLCLLPGTAHASMISVESEASLFPTGGVYVPVVGPFRDQAHPLFFYDFFALPAGVPVDTGITQYDFNFAAMSMTSNPFQADSVATGTASTEEIGGGQFETCWAVGCSPSLLISPDPQFTITTIDQTTQLFRADPDAGPGRQSTGLMTVTGGPGAWEITSFFDIYFEMCVDSCDDTPQWQDAGSVHYELFAQDSIPTPEPATLMLLGSGLLLGARGYRVRRARKLQTSSATVTPPA